LFVSFLIILTIINPIIFGYYHSLLTEYVAISLGVLSCYLSLNYLYTDYYSERKLFVLYAIIIVFLVVFAWFLKQPYFSTVLFPFLVSNILAVSSKFSLKNVLPRLISFIVCLFVLALSILFWNRFLTVKGVDLNTSRNVSKGLGNQLIGSIDYLEVEQDDDRGEFVISLYNKKGEIVESKIIKSNRDFVPTKDAVILISSYFFKYPSLILDSYFANYLSIINIYRSYTIDGVRYNVSREFDLDFINENQAIAYRIYNNSENIFYMVPERLERVLLFNQTNNPPIYLNKLMLFFCTPFNYIFKFSFILLPFTLLVSISYKIFSLIKKRNNNLLNIVIIMLGFSFAHMLLHIITEARLDRYASPAIITVIIGNILLFYSILKKIFIKVTNARTKKKYKQKR
jgi:hypothetical protein